VEQAHAHMQTSFVEHAMFVGLQASCLLYSKVNVVHLWGPMEIDGFSAPTAESGGNASRRMASNL